MAKLFKVEVVTPKGIVLDKEVEEIVAPGVLGEFGVLIGHTPMLTFLKPGVLSYLENDKFTKFVVGAGFCEVLKETVSVLVEEAYRADEIDPASASAELAQWEGELKKLDAAKEAAEYENVTKRIQVARAKVNLASGSAH
ncbi:MAG: ATP synthase F1 subunit epsilon [Pseudomonadota bacterium]